MYRDKLGVTVGYSEELKKWVVKKKDGLLVARTVSLELILIEYSIILIRGYRVNDCEDVFCCLMYVKEMVEVAWEHLRED